MVPEDPLTDEQRAALDGRANRLQQAWTRGTLPGERLRLAAYLGDAAAALVLDSEAPEPPEDPSDWVLGLEVFGSTLCQRAALRAAQVALPMWERIHPDDGRPRRAVEAAKRVMEEPSDERRGLAQAASLEARGAWEDVRRRPASTGALQGAFKGAEKTALLAADVARLAHDPDAPVELAAQIVSHAVAALAGSAWTALAAWDLAEERLRREMCAELLALVDLPD